MTKSFPQHFKQSYLNLAGFWGQVGSNGNNGGSYGRGVGIFISNIWSGKAEILVLSSKVKVGQGFSARNDKERFRDGIDCHMA